MSKFRCAYAVPDDLHHFAALWLAHPVRNKARVLWADGARVERLYVSHEYQVVSIHARPVKGARPHACKLRTRMTFSPGSRVPCSW